MKRVFEGKVALITGAGSGIGRELARQLRDLGATLVLTDVDGDAVQAVAAELGGEVHVHDVRDLERWQQIVAETVETHRAIDYLFNNAGVAVIGPTHTFSIDDWRRVLDVNVDGVVHGVFAAYPGMVERGRGHIVNVASVAGLFPSAGQASYVTSKYAVVGLSHALRAEAALHGVKVTVACPGIIQTKMRRTLPVKGVSGDRLRAMLPEGARVEDCVRRILRGVARNEATVVITPLAQALAGVARLAPTLGHWLNRASFALLSGRLQDS